MTGILARKSMSTGGLWFYSVSASAPMTVLAGGVVATFAATGVIGVPLAFLLLTAALWVLTVAYTAMARYIPHAAPFYALLARGLGRPWGVAGGLVALLAYNAVEIALFGLVGETMAPLVHHFVGDINDPWWIGAAVIWISVAVCGALRVDISGTVLKVLLLGEIAVIVIFDIASFLHPADGHVSTAPLQPSHLVVNGIGGVLALSVAAFLGWETAQAYAEEARTDRAAGRATLGALLLLGPFYAVSSWALTIAVGPSHIVAATQADADLPFTVMSQTLGVFGPLISGLGRIFLVTSIFAAMLSFHGTASRYTFALAREHVLPTRLARTGSGGSSRRDAPIGGSLVQSALAAVVVTLFALAHAAPIAVLFTWLAALAAVAVLILLTAVSAAAIPFFIKKGGGGGTKELSTWASTWAPPLGLVIGGGVTGVAVWNLDTLLGVANGSPLTYVIPAAVLLAILAGLIRAGVLHQQNPAAYRTIGHGRPDDLAIPDQRLNDVLRPLDDDEPLNAGLRWPR